MYDRAGIVPDIPETATVYESSYPAPTASDAKMVMEAIRKPIGSPPLEDLLQKRRSGEIVIAVSDITRPIPYARFLPALLTLVESAGVKREEVVLLVATGMHRPTTPAERLEMFGHEILAKYRIVDHRAEQTAELVRLPARSWSGNLVQLNRRFMEAEFRIITGLVEPHFMAGFSGGRKTVCPGISDLETIAKFHGAEFLSNPRACNGCLESNPCHEEALSIARLADVGFSLNVVLDRKRRVVRAFAGGLESAHAEACRFVRQHACVPVSRPADVVVTSCGGYPLDTTFYQCVKGFVGCLPAVKPDGRIIAFGSCSEGIGSPEYERLLRSYSGKWRKFLQDLRKSEKFF
ncbi:MAG: nickel-dependent lactate racemase [Kiritimatiellia bacterium]